MLIETNRVEWDRQEIAPGQFQDVAVFSPQVLTDTEIIRYEINQLQRRVEKMSERIKRYKKYSNYERLKEGYLDFDNLISRLILVSHDVEHIYQNYTDATDTLLRAGQSRS